MKKEMFRRNTRMTHRFGAQEKGGPFDETFDPQFPDRPSKRSSPALEIHRHGEHRYNAPLSPVAKHSGGNASLNGPAPDVPDCIAFELPASIKKRKS